MSGIGSKRAFTFVEVMIAVTILAVAMVVVIRGYASMINTLEASDYSIESVSLLKEKMFEVREEALKEGNLTPGTKNGKAVRLIASSLHVDEEIEESEDSKEGDKEFIMYLNEVNITVSDEKSKPVRRYSLITYVEGYEENVSE